MARKSKLSKKHRRKVGEAVSKTAEDFPRDLPERKRCSRCELWKDASEFLIRKHKLKSGVVSRTLNSWCRLCVNQGAEQWRQTKRSGGELAALQRCYKQKWRTNLSAEKREEKNRRNREWSAAQRRSEGIEPRGGAIPRPPGKHESVDASPLVTLLRREMEHWEKESGYPVSGLLAEAVGISQRRLYALLHGEQVKVALPTVDKILVGLGLPHMLSILYPEV